MAESRTLKTYSLASSAHSSNVKTHHSRAHQEMFATFVPELWPANSSRLRKIRILLKPHAWLSTWLSGMIAGAVAAR